MALFPLNAGGRPLGQFDMLDTELSVIKGGEILTLTEASRTNTTIEKAAADVFDGYIAAAPGVGSRSVATIASLAAEAPLFLVDEGSSPDYLTSFGTLVGSTVGINTTGTILGPHTATGSGKVTLWDQPGLYVITVDAIASDFQSTEGLLDGYALSAGDILGFNNSGQLAHGSCSGVVTGSGVCNFVEFESGGKTGAIVNTPPRLVGSAEVFDRIKVWYHAGLGNRTIVT